jgi:hypothetical protein
VTIEGIEILAFSLACIVGIFFFAVWLIEDRVERIEKLIISMKKTIDDLKDKYGNSN